MAKKRWKITIQKSTGKLLNAYYSRRGILAADLMEVDPYEFQDVLTYANYYNSPSSVELQFTSKHFKDSTVITSMRFLDRVFQKNMKTNIKIIKISPLTIQGKFTFAKKGSVIHIVEVI